MELPPNEKCLALMNEIIEQFEDAQVNLKRKRKYSPSEKAMYGVHLAKCICVLENARKETYEQST